MTIIVAIARSGSKEESCACALAVRRLPAIPSWDQQAMAGLEIFNLMGPNMMLLHILCWDSMQLQELKLSAKTKISPCSSPPTVSQNNPL